MVWSLHTHHLHLSRVQLGRKRGRHRKLDLPPRVRVCLLVHFRGQERVHPVTADLTDVQKSPKTNTSPEGFPFDRVNNAASRYKCIYFLKWTEQWPAPICLVGPLELHLTAGRLSHASACFSPSPECYGTLSTEKGGSLGVLLYLPKKKKKDSTERGELLLKLRYYEQICVQKFHNPSLLSSAEK